MFYILMSILTGVIIVICRILNTKLSEEIGLIESSYFNYFTAAITSILLFFIMREKFVFTSLSTVPFYAYLGGFLGVAIVVLNSVVTPKMSAFYVTLLIFVAQLFTGVALDWLISRQFPLSKIIGGLIVVAGLAYNLHIDFSDSKVAENETT
ncbi:DMT family transporter [Clostridium botulinum]|uniref:DMT family transporter n=1 Tax=Clostridium botulinum TaxID=1491 RepID=A0A0C2N9D9_CLOBO|nr:MULTISPECIES: DMT family transporter [Clostridium]ACD52027.1 putative membrane protein [Clostridium botulinum E3 str. Alaska E43]AJF29462.1 membrane protein [Clostridium botulinum]AJF32523.1 membrane protein [Clostridium botulinum]KIL09695.1 membrane protein [Clostridium botulinum]KOM86700.1 membrane protein [Clostridium botulinum]